MTERATVFETVQIGVEAGGTPGTAVNCDVKLPSIMFDIGVTPEIKTYRGSGYKHPSVSALNNEWVEATLSGPVTYNEIVYLFSSVLDVAAITDNTLTTGEGTWVFTPDPDGPDAPATFTVEQGSSVRVHEFSHGLVTALGLKFSGDGVELDGTMIGEALTDASALTASPTQLALVPVTRPQVKFYLDATWAALGTTALTRVFSAEWNLSDRHGPVWALDGTSSYAATVETVPTLEVKLLLEADAVGMGLLTNMRANTSRFLRIEAIGPVIDGIIFHKMTIDTALKVTNVDKFSDEDGVYAIEWTFEAFLDPTGGDVYDVTVINTVGSL